MWFIHVATSGTMLISEGIKFVQYDLTVNVKVKQTFLMRNFLIITIMN